MKSFRNFNKKINQTTQLQCKPDPKNCQTAKRIWDITDSSYKLETKKNNRSRFKTEHSLQTKSPIRIPQNYIKKTTEKQLTFRQQKQNRLNSEDEIFKIEASIPVTSNKNNSPENNSSIFDLLNWKKNSQFIGSQFQSKDSQLLMNNQQLQCLKDMWKSIEKLKEKRQISKYVDQMKSILNKICKKSLRPQFSFIQEIQRSVQKTTHFANLDSNAIESSPYSPSNQKQSCEEHQTKNKQQYKLSPKRLFNSNESQNITLQTDHESKIEYKKIMYMLDRKSQTIASQQFQKPEQSLYELNSSEKQSRKSESYRKKEEQIKMSSIDSTETKDKKSNKRAVLNEIVNLLNTKYKKNIKLN